MSVRAVEGRFNLRSMVADETASKPVVLTQSPIQSGLFRQPYEPRVSSKSGLKFDFSKIHVSPQRSRDKSASKLDISQAKLAASFKNPFETSKDSNKADVMRLAAIVDDLQSRLKKATERASVSEMQLHRTHAELLAERSSSEERMKAANAQIGAAHATESKLRSELSKASKVAAATAHKTKEFENAVSAVMASESAAEKSKKEIDALKSKLSMQESAANEMASKIIALENESARSDEKSMQLYKEVSDATHAVSVAKEAERSAIEERERIRLELADAKTALQKAIDEQHATDAKTPELQEESEHEVEPVSQTSVGDAQHDMCTTHVDMAGCPKCESGPPVGTNPHTSIDDHNTIDNVPSEEVPLTIPVRIDPIKTHARYNSLRDRVLSLTAHIVRMQSSDEKDESLQAMVEKRDDLYKRAKDLKSRYDTMFGAVEPDSVVNLSGTESFVASTPEDKFDVIEAEEAYYAPVGDAPQPPMTYTISFARDMAGKCPLGGAFDFGSLDGGSGIGKATVKPITFNRVVIGEEAQQHTDQAEGDTPKVDMVSAVVKDITAFLKHVKLEADAFKANVAIEAVCKTYE